MLFLAQLISSQGLAAAFGEAGQKVPQAVQGTATEVSKESQKAPPDQADQQGESEGKLLPAEVFHCNDGDTCRIKVADALWLNVRLAGIDAPEVAKTRGNKLGQEYGTEAREYLNKAVKGKKIEVRQVDLDPFNRPVVEIFDKSLNINLHLVEEGFAEVYRGKTKRLDKGLYHQAEEKAKKAKKGIWSIAKYQSPKEFRQQQKN